MSNTHSSHLAPPGGYSALDLPFKPLADENDPSLTKLPQTEGLLNFYRNGRLKYLSYLQTASISHLGIFNALANKPQPSTELMRIAELEERPFAAVMLALEAHGYVDLIEGKYELCKAG